MSETLFRLDSNFESSPTSKLKPGQRIRNLRSKFFRHFILLLYDSRLPTTFLTSFVNTLPYYGRCTVHGTILCYVNKNNNQSRVNSRFLFLLSHLHLLPVWTPHPYPLFVPCNFSFRLIISYCVLNLEVSQILRKKSSDKSVPLVVPVNQI